MAKVKLHRQGPLYLLVAVILSLGIMALPGYCLADGVTILFEDFEGGLPAGWTVLDNGCDCLSNCCRNWTDSNPCNRTAQCGCLGIFMIADSDCCLADPWMDTELRTPSIDCSGYSKVTLEFDHYFWYVAAEKADVDVSNDGGGNWTNILAYRADACGHVSKDISAQAANQSDVTIRWRYYLARYEWYWEVDNVKLSGTPLGPVPVGGEAYPIDKTSVLAPLIAVAVLLAGGMGWYALRRRRVHS